MYTPPPLPLFFSLPPLPEEAELARVQTGFEGCSLARHGAGTRMNQSIKHLSRLRFFLFFLKSLAAERCFFSQHRSSFAVRTASPTYDNDNNCTCAHTHTSDRAQSRASVVVDYNARVNERRQSSSNLYLFPRRQRYRGGGLVEQRRLVIRSRGRRR